MVSPPHPSAPIISPAEIQILVSRAGLVLNPGQVADLVLAWRQVAGLIGAMNRERKMADDMALVFRLPPPAVEPPTQAKPPGKPRGKRATAASPTRVKEGAAAKGKPAAKAKPAPRLAPAEAAARKAPAKAKRR